MAIRPSQPEIITVNSEALQTQIRDLLPSQNGFGSELQATNVITPIIDLTAAAEGDSLAVDLQRAIAFGSQTAFSESNSSSVIANSPGWYRIIGTAVIRSSGATASSSFTMTDGLSVKTVWALTSLLSSSDAGKVSESFDFIVGLTTGDSISAVATSVAFLNGSIRQVADSTGTIVNPSGLPL